jgi:hypothetical protein
VPILSSAQLAGNAPMDVSSIAARLHAPPPVQLPKPANGAAGGPKRGVTGISGQRESDPEGNGEKAGAGEAREGTTGLGGQNMIGMQTAARLAVGALDPAPFNRARVLHAFLCRMAGKGDGIMSCIAELAVGVHCHPVHSVPFHSLLPIVSCILLQHCQMHVDPMQCLECMR